MLRAVEVRPGVLGDVRVRDAKIDEIGPALAGRGERVVGGDGGALLPGLHDHHCHLLAPAAAFDSVLCGPPAVTPPADLAAALRAGAQRAADAGPDDGWVRGVNYDEAVAGPLDCSALDRFVASVPTRIQHRSGA